MFKRILNLILLVIVAGYVSRAFAQENPLIYQTFIRDGAAATGGYLSIRNPLTFNEIERIDFPSTTFSFLDRLTLLPDKKTAIINVEPFLDDKKGFIVVDLENKKEKARIFEGVGVTAIKLSPDGMIWALISGTQEILVLDPKDFNIESRIKLDEVPIDILFSSSGDKRAYISLLNTDVFVFDYVSKRSITAIRNLPKRSPNQVRPQELELSPDGTTLYVGSTDTISIIDASGFPLRVTGSFQLPEKSPPGFLLKSNPDGKTLYVAEYLGVDVYAYDVRAKTINKMAVPRGRGIITSLNIPLNSKLLYISRFYGISFLDTEFNSFITNIVTSTGSAPPSPFSLGTTLSGNFSIGQAPTLKVNSPVANDNFVAGQNITVKWDTTVAPQSYSIATHKVELSIDGGQTFNTITGAEELPAAVQEFNWVVPNIEVISKAQVRVSTVDLGARQASSVSGNFSIIKTTPGDIQAPTVNFLSPKGNEEFTVGNNLQIIWISSDNVGVTSQDLSLSLDGGNTFPISIANGLTGTIQSFAFPIPENLLSSQARLRLIVKDAAGNMSQAVTPSNFTIKESPDSTPPVVTISSPSNNSSLMAGQSIQVKWQSTDNRAVGSQALLISFNGGQNFTEIQTFGAADNSFVISNIDKLNFTTSQTIIRITAKDSAGNVGQANAQFVIKPMVAIASYQAKLLTINGLGFQSNSMSNSNSNIQILINDKAITLLPKSFNNMSLTIKGNKKKLNLVRGSNSVKVVVDSVESNTSVFVF